MVLLISSSGIFKTGEEANTTEPLFVRSRVNVKMSEATGNKLRKAASPPQELARIKRNRTYLQKMLALPKLNFSKTVRSTRSKSSHVSISFHDPCRSLDAAPKTRCSHS